MRSSYAVLWSSEDGAGSGRLESLAGGFELHGRGSHRSIPFSTVTAAAIARGHVDRLHDLPVLALELRDGAPLRIASLEGAGALHELAELVERSGLAVGAD
jgi:hypothetical protein